MAKITLGTLTSAFSSISKLNANFTAIVAALQNNVLYRVNSTGEANQMENELDMNDNAITNAANIDCTSLYIGGTQVVAGSVTPVPTTYIAAGTVSAPGLPVTGDANTGVYAAGADELDIAAGGVKSAGFTATGVQIPGTLTAGATTLGATVLGATTLAGGLTISTGGLVISAGGLNVTGTVTLPAHALASACTATTQAQSDNSTKIATTAYVDAAAAASSGTKVYATMSSTQTLAHQTSAAIVFNTETQDALGEYNNATGKFTAANTGTYQICAQLETASYAWATTDLFLVSIRKNGTEILVAPYLATQVGYTGCAGSALNVAIPLTAGDYIEVFGYQNRGANTNVSGAHKATFLSITRV